MTTSTTVVYCFERQCSTRRTVRRVCMKRQQSPMIYVLQVMMERKEKSVE
jgi:hypothetical protein